MALARTVAAASMAGLMLAAAGAAEGQYVFRARPATIGTSPGNAANALRITAGATVTVEAGSAAVLGAAGGTAPYSWTAATLPQGITLSADGKLTVGAQVGAATVTGLRLTARDAAGNSVDATLDLVVTAPPPGNMVAFGSNDYGQALPWTAGSVATATAVGTKNWTAVAARDGTTCAISAGILHCWGRNQYGQAATGDQNHVTDGPRAVADGGGWTALASGAGYSACGVRNGQALCWGQLVTDNANTVATTLTPTLVDGGSTGWTALATGTSSRCGIRNGEVYCWGRNDGGQLAVGDALNATQPRRSGTGSNWTAIASGYSFKCGLSGDRLYCWGEGTFGTLGDGTTNYATTHRPVDGGSGGWTAVTANAYHACGIRQGALYCWGNGSSGKLGTGSSTATNATPVRVGTASDWTAVVAGTDSTCGLRGGKLMCWGANNLGQVGQGTVGGSFPAPQLVTGDVTGIRILASGGSHAVGLK
jgi:hypothetical protein